MADNCLIRLVDQEPDLRACFPVMVQLRPHLDEATFVQQAQRQMRDGGYQVAVLLKDDVVRAVAGFSLTETLHSGRHLYVDDLVTSDGDRSSGFGGQLLRWLVQHARQNGCRMFELDSGVQRADAHRFYFREGMVISSFRFRLPLS